MIAADVVPAAPSRRLIDWLEDHGVPYSVQEHAASFTARETARLEGVDPEDFAKTVAVQAADGRRALFVLDADDMLDLVAVAELLGTPSVRLLTELEMDHAVPDCEPGTLPPVPEVVGMPVFADDDVSDADAITFRAGSHRHTVRVGTAEWAAAADVQFADISD